jgi:hypothetical protein
MTAIHEVGHAAGLNHVHGNKHRKNVMHEVDGRENFYRFQVESIGKASFARKA